MNPTHSSLNLIVLPARPTHQSEYEHLPPNTSMTDKEVWKWLQTKQLFGEMPKFSELTGDFRTTVRALHQHANRLRAYGWTE